MLHSRDFRDALEFNGKDWLWPLGLYNGVAWERNRKLFYLGAQDQFFTFNMFDAQAWWARDVILGRISLPDSATMAAESAAWRAREEGVRNDEAAIYFQGTYVEALMLVVLPLQELLGVGAPQA